MAIRRVTAAQTHREFHAASDKMHGKRPPLRTLRELAEEFGITPNSMRMYLAHDVNAPKPEMRTGGNTWYNPAAVRAWWNARGQK